MATCLPSLPAPAPLQPPWSALTPCSLGPEGDWPHHQLPCLPRKSPRPLSLCQACPGPGTALAPTPWVTTETWAPGGGPWVCPVPPPPQSAAPWLWWTCREGAPAPGLASSSLRPPPEAAALTHFLANLSEMHPPTWRPLCFCSPLTESAGGHSRRRWQRVCRLRGQGPLRPVMGHSSRRILLSLGAAL